MPGKKDFVSVLAADGKRCISRRGYFSATLRKLIVNLKDAILIQIGYAATTGVYPGWSCWHTTSLHLYNPSEHQIDDGWRQDRVTDRWII